MANNAMEAIGFLMRSETAITDIVATMVNPDTSAPTSFPLIVYGVLPETQQGLPAISYYQGSYLNKFGAASDQTFTINCYADNATTSRVLAIAVYELFADAVGDGNGYPIQTFSTILQSIPEQDGNVVNTPVQVRAISIRA